MSPSHQPSADWPALHGARALSIVAVLACHLLPLGPKTWVDLNITVGQFGMSIFFGLSAFLIAHKLTTEPSITAFLVNRFFRIFPLLWLILGIDFAYRTWGSVDLGLPASTMLLHASTLINNWPNQFLKETGHLWSVCVEVHFYLIASLAFGLAARKGLIGLIFTGLALAIYRASTGDLFNTTTLYRLDELLIPLAVVPLLSRTQGSQQPSAAWRLLLNPTLTLPALAVCCLAPPHPVLFPLRPVLATLLIAGLLNNTKSVITRLLCSRALRWLSEHAYALYLIHPFLVVTWLGTGDTKLIIYMKRPLLIAVLLLLAYLSTRYYERAFIDLGKRLIGRHPKQPLSPHSRNPSHEHSETRAV